MSQVVQVQDLGIQLGNRDVVSGISFNAAPGDLVAVLGPNGSGKSTLVRSLVGLVRPSSGHIRILGFEPGHAVSSEVGYVPQIKTLDRTFPARAVELVASARRSTWPGFLSPETQEWSTRALERVGALHLADRQVSDLSGGELQRVYLARALARRVRLLILDEPETGIDALGTLDLYAQLDAFRMDGRGTVILVTHDWDAAVHHASHVLLIKGSQISFGPPDEALEDRHVRAAFGHVGHAHGVQSVLGHARPASDSDHEGRPGGNQGGSP